MDSAGNSLITKENSDKIGSHLTMVHEFCHAFVNPELDKEINRKNLQSSGTYLFKLSEPTMRRSAYPRWEFVINESVVRALEICFAKEHKDSEQIIRSKMIYEIQNGFFWMPELVQFMEGYQKNRRKYPSFDTFYPQIIKFFDSYVADHQSMIKRAIE